MPGGAIDSDNYTIGGAKIYFAASVGAQNCLSTEFQTSANNLGNIVSAEITPDVTYVEHFTSSNGKRIKDKEVAVTSMINVSFVFDEMNQGNLQRFLLGSSISASKFAVFGSQIAEGSAQIVIETEIGQDFLYRIPKCTLRPDGGLGLDPESWHEAPMTLSVLEYISGDYTNASPTIQTSVNASWLTIPFGEFDTAEAAVV